VKPDILKGGHLPLIALHQLVVDQLMLHYL